MIALSSDHLIFQLTNGESVPCSAEMISIEIVGHSESGIDAEMLRHAAASVFHYFKCELERQTVTVGEFALALEKVLRNFGLTLYADETQPFAAPILEADLCHLARESDSSLELFFFPRLRDELRVRLRQSPRLLRFSGLRRCVKQLAGAQRWSGRCEKIQDQIVEYLRECLTAEPAQKDCALVVE
jgi:hypothetical protein